jgi:hypothetical protein
MIAQDKSLPDKLLKAGGADMVHLYETKGFYEATQNKGLPFWQKQLGMDKIGWQRTVPAQADFMLKYTGHFRRCAEAIKTMVK